MPFTFFKRRGAPSCVAARLRRHLACASNAAACLHVGPHDCGVALRVHQTPWRVSDTDPVGAASFHVKPVGRGIPPRKPAWVRRRVFMPYRGVCGRGNLHSFCTAAYLCNLDQRECGGVCSCHAAACVGAAAFIPFVPRRVCAIWARVSAAACHATACPRTDVSKIPADGKYAW